MKVYLSGPITHHSYAGATDWRENVALCLNISGIQTLDPMRGKSFLSNQADITEEEYQAPDRPHLSDKALVQRDFADCQAADILLVNLLPEEDTGISRGTTMELAWGYAFHKLCVIVQKPDSKLQHPFVREMGVMFSNLDDAITYIISCR